MSKLVEHQGVIKDIHNGIIEVKIEQSSACASCHAKNSCSIIDKTDKIIEIFTNDISYSIGETVMVMETKSLGLQAVFFSYILPLIVVISVIIIFLAIGKSEIFAAIAALSSLLPYYALFLVFKKKIKDTFVFTIKKTTNND
jgi:sigma-E factor negative regulatory protein RseC